MKKISLLLGLSLLLTGLVFNACKKDDDNTVEDAVLPEGWNPTAIAVPAAAGTYAVTLNLPGTWQAFVNTGSSWCSISQMTGTDQTDLTITFKDNLGKARTSTVMAFSSTGATHTLTVSQDGSPYLCSGKPGVNNYFPLAVGNKWEYDFWSDDESWEVTTTEVISGMTYFKVLEKNQQGTFTKNYRIAANGDVYQYASGADRLLVPANPTVGQDIGPDPELPSLCPHRSVISTTWSLLPSPYSGCTWTNVLYIEKYGQTGGVVNRCYYIKGLGLVADTDLDLLGVKIQ